MLRRKPTREWVELDPHTIALALDGDRAAFTKLYRHYAGVVRGAVAARMRAWPSMSAQLEDVLSEVWAQILANDRRALRRYDPSRGELGFFLRMLAASRAATVLRRHARQQAALAPADSESTEEIERALLQRDFLDALWARARPLIKDVDEELFVRVMVLGREAKEVAPELGLGQDAAYQRLTRLRSRLVQLSAMLLEDGHAGSRPLTAERVQAVLHRALVLLLFASSSLSCDRPSIPPDDVSPGEGRT
ncbi:RNA polymerase sigma factor [Paraliomyxa miuraensis]|uniref:RNA polymerase sigma factor n=1 Tax=Paraliomyxa miuraensis TaxID=376150 RepID=UPI002253A3EE|nr:sigma-70 family RNA polymerase sigma factor [Paraliomyxa miuraensis]MCX4247786.1 sigma-70 family RNA polymerase sigma factor [Paraliomyxa miuraensis]